MSNFKRRRWLIALGFGGLMGCDWIAAHPSNPANAKLSDDDRALKFKYRGIRGAELLVDSLEEVQGVNMFDDRGGRFFGRASLSLRNSNRYSYSYSGGDIALPKWIRVEWRNPGEWENRKSQDEPRDWSKIETQHGPGGAYVWDGGVVAGNYTVKIAERIPDKLLDEVRARRGSLRLKIRVHPQGVLVGWDLHAGLSSYFVGGDFQEAHMVYEGDPMNPTKRWVNGWYIHPRTGQRIETQE